MRALTGYDRVTLVLGERVAESSRGLFAAPADFPAHLPAIIADAEAQGVALFPRETDEESIDAALMCAPTREALDKLAAAGVRSTLRVPFFADGAGAEFLCESRTACEPSFELHAAAELFVQLFALRLEIDRLKG